MNIEILSILSLLQVVLVAAIILVIIEMFRSIINVNEGRNYKNKRYKYNRQRNLKKVDDFVEKLDAYEKTHYLALVLVISLIIIKIINNAGIDFKSMEFLVLVFLIAMKINYKGNSFIDLIKREQIEKNKMKKDAEINELLTYIKTEVNSIDKNSINTENVLAEIVHIVKTDIKKVATKFLVEYRNNNKEKAKLIYLKEYNTDFGRDTLDVLEKLDDNVLIDDLILRIESLQNSYSLKHKEHEIRKIKGRGTLFLGINTLIVTVVLGVVMSNLYGNIMINGL
jgi:hypothetical protein